MTNPIDDLFHSDETRKFLFKKLYDHHPRKYHNNEHIEYMWDTHLLFRDSIRDENGQSIRDYDFQICLAIIFHDIVYEPTSKTNEEDSAQFFLDYLNVDDGIVCSNPEEIHRVILATKNHLSTEHDSLPFWGRYLLDLDLYGMGDSELYTKNGKKIREEYYMFSDEEFYKGRISFLENFLSHERIFRVFTFREKSTRLNMQNDLKGLK